MKTGPENGYKNRSACIVFLAKVGAVTFLLHVFLDVCIVYLAKIGAVTFFLACVSCCCIKFEKGTMQALRFFISNSRT